MDKESSVRGSLENSVIIFRLWTDLHLEDLHCSWITHWVIEITGGIFCLKGQRRTFWWTSGKFSFDIFRLLIDLYFKHLCRLLLNLSGGCDNMNSYLERFPEIQVFIITVLSSSNPIKHRLVHFWSFLLVLLAIPHIWKIHILDHYWRDICVCDSSDRKKSAAVLESIAYIWSVA